MNKGLMVVVAFGALSLTGCEEKKEPAPANDNLPKPVEPSAKPSEAPKPQLKTGRELADQYATCGKHIEAGDWDAFKKNCVMGEFSSHVADMAQAQNGEQVIEFLKSMKSSFPDLKMQPQLVIVSGPNVLTVQLMTGTNENPMRLPGIPESPATHKKIGTLYFQRVLFAEGKTEQWTFNDSHTLMGQLGSMPKEAGATRPARDKGWEGAPIVLVSTDDAKEKANIEMAKKAVEAINSHKPAEADATVTEDVLVSDQADAKDSKGKKEFHKGLQSLLTAFPDFKLTDSTYWAAGDWVVWIGTMTGTWKGPLGTLKPNGQPVSTVYAQVIRVKDGKASEIWRFRNSLPRTAAEPPKKK